MQLKAAQQKVDLGHADAHKHTPKSLLFGRSMHERPIAGFCIANLRCGTVSEPFAREAEKPGRFLFNSKQQAFIQDAMHVNGDRSRNLRGA
jgi:hypothetical protein